MATEWKKVRLGDIADFINGGAWSDKEYATKGIGVLKISNWKSSGYDLTNIDYLPYELEEKYIANKLYKNDVIIATVGSHPNLIESAAGRSIIISNEIEGFYLNQNQVCVRTKNKEIIDQQYLGYLTQYFPFKHYIQMRGRGAANQMRIAISSIKEYKLSLPPLETQKKIVGILSAYDDLIENNRKQIKLLEEAAQKLYKEWFVKLNFPGHENVKIVDGVPEGWKKVRAEDYFEVTIGKTPPRNETKWFSKGNIGKKWISIADMGNSGVFIFQTSENLTNEAIESKNVKIIPANTVLLSFKLTVGRVSITTEEMTTNEAIAHFVTDNKFIREYIYLYLKNFHYDSLGSTSAISTAINSKIVKSMPIIIPPESLLEFFSKLVAPYFDKIKSLQNQIQLLQSARDKLLPKLMNGEYV